MPINPEFLPDEIPPVTDDQIVVAHLVAGMLPTGDAEAVRDLDGRQMPLLILGSYWMNKDPHVAILPIGPHRQMSLYTPMLLSVDTAAGIIQQIRSMFDRIGLGLALEQSLDQIGAAFHDHTGGRPVCPNATPGDTEHICPDCTA